MGLLKVNISGVDKLELEIKRKFELVASNKQMLNKIGETSVERMRFEARKKTPLQGKKKGSFPSGYPKPSTVKARRELAKNNKTHETFKPSRGNLTLTGQLLEAIQFKLKKSGGILFFIAGPRVPYKNKDGSFQKTSSNAVVYNKLLELNRKFRVIGIDDKLEKSITNIVRRTLRRALKF